MGSRNNEAKQTLYWQSLINITEQKGVLGNKKESFAVSVQIVLDLHVLEWCSHAQLLMSRNWSGKIGRSQWHRTKEGAVYLSKSSAPNIAKCTLYIWHNMVLSTVALQKGLNQVTSISFNVRSSWYYVGTGWLEFQPKLIELSLNKSTCCHEQMKQIHSSFHFMTSWLYKCPNSDWSQILRIICFHCSCQYFYMIY